MTSGVQCQHKPPHTQHVPMPAKLLEEQALHIGPAAGSKASKCCQQSRPPTCCQRCTHIWHSRFTLQPSSCVPVCSSALCSVTPAGSSQLLPILSSALPASQLLTEAQPPGASPQHCSLLFYSCWHITTAGSCYKLPSPFSQQCAFCLTAADSSQCTATPPHLWVLDVQLPPVV